MMATKKVITSKDLAASIRATKKLKAEKVNGLRLYTTEFALEFFGAESLTPQGIALVNTILMQGRRDEKAHALMQLINLLSVKKAKGAQTELIFYTTYQAGLFLDEWAEFFHRVGAYMQTKDKRFLAPLT